MKGAPAALHADPEYRDGMARTCLTGAVLGAHNSGMATTGPTSELQNAVDKAARGYRNSSEMRHLAEEQDRAGGIAAHSWSRGYFR